MPTVIKQVVKPKGKAVVLRTPKAQLQSAWDMSGTMSLLLYGRSATGKTTLWATFPKPILAIICSGGMKPGELKSIDTPEYRRTIHPYAIRSTDEYATLLDRAGNHATVVLDHGSGLQDLAVKEYLGLSEIPLAMYRKAGKGESWSLVSQQGWGQIAIRMKEMFRALLDLPQHKVIVAQERSFGEEANSELIAPFIGAAMTPSVVGWLNPACDVICETFIRQKVIEKTAKVGGKTVVTKLKAKGVEYCLRTAPDPVYTTKFRVPKGKPLPDVLVDPTFEKINAALQGA